MLTDVVASLASAVRISFPFSPETVDIELGIELTTMVGIVGAETERVFVELGCDFVREVRSVL